ncbi:angiopoietin-related protein 3-like [Drosophila nasuta]|uniref:angiopoietin-related protein 3-like n=1 Tax=Drosophila nasuta TaxID=42062 RepID=UPI00295F42C6|nr:angiopoietin-related protein 3-like [Drosophila nasuta]
MKKRFEFFSIFLIIVEIWTVCSQPREGEFISTTSLPNEENKTTLNYDAVIFNLKDQLAQCRAENKTQTDTDLLTILRRIQKLETNNNNNNNDIEFELKLKEKVEIIAAQKTQLKNKLKLLDDEINETIKARQEASDYMEQIKKLQLTIASQNATINQNNAEIGELKSELNKKNNEIQKEKEERKSIKSRQFSCEGREINLATKHQGSQHQLMHCEFDQNSTEYYLRRNEHKLNECLKLAATLPKRFPTSCLNLTSGIHEIQIRKGNPFQVLCDGDGWMIIQRRFNGSQDFDKSWEEYVNGFGDLNGEFFMGLEKQHLVTSLKKHDMHFKLTSIRGVSMGKYDNFRIGNAASHYTLQSIGKFYAIQVENNLERHVNQKFTTYDRNNIPNGYKNCAANGMGGWWYPEYCGDSNLNAPLGKDSGIVWFWTGGTSSIMKIRQHGY